MKVLVVIGHPDRQPSLTRDSATAFADGARSAGHEVDVLDLAQETFEPVLRFGYRERMVPDPLIERSQALLLACDHLALAFPVWWAAEPSLLKGWFDRVLTPGIAYRFGRYRPGRLLSGKTATLISSGHAPGFYARARASYPLRRIRRDVLGYCGVKTTKVLYFGRAGQREDTTEARARFHRKVAEVARALA